MSDAASVNISLPKVLEDFVRERCAEEGHGDPGDYIRALIREDRKRRAGEKLEKLLLEGLQSGPPVSMTRGDWDEIHREVREHIAKRQRQGA